ncbi:hypothetical protein Tco_1412732 [Tanacetum coccineum]
MGSTLAQTRSERVLEQPNEPPLSEGHTSGSGEGRMEHTFELTKSVPPTPHDSPLTGGYTPRSDEGRLKLQDLMVFCTKLSKQVLDLENAKGAQVVEILKLKQRVKKLERQRKSSISHPRRRKYRQVESSDDDLDEEDASKQGRIKDKIMRMFKENDFDELHNDTQEETVDATTNGVSTVSVPVTTAGVTISTAEPRTPPITTTVFDDEDVTMAMAQTLIKMKEQKAKEKGVAFSEEEETPKLTTTRSITTLQPLSAIDPKDKGKGVLVEEEPDPSVKVKRKLERSQTERAAQEKASMDAIYEEYDNIQASIDADALFAAKIQQEEREQFTVEERARFLAEIIATQRKFRAIQRAAEIRSKPPTKNQLRNMMMTFLKNMGRFTHNQLKGKSYEDLQSAKRQKTEATAEEQESIESDQEDTADYEQENEELRMWLTVVPDEEETMDREILSTKYPIVDWESQTLGSNEVEDLHVYKIIRADGNTSYHKTLSTLEVSTTVQDDVVVEDL